MSKRKNHLKRFFVPHHYNQYKPHSLREASVLFIAALALIAFAATTFQSFLFFSNNDFAAAVLPSVLIDLANNDRVENDLAALTVNPVLQEAAQMKANDMAEHSYFAHESPSGLTPWYWFVKAGYSFASAGENLAVNFGDASDVEEAWMDSPTHRANILSGKYTEIGIATAEGVYKGKKTIFVVQMFGKPAGAGTGVAESPSEIAVAEEPVVTNESAVLAAQKPALQDEIGEEVAPAPRAATPPQSTTEYLGVNPSQLSDAELAQVSAVTVTEESDTFIAVESVHAVPDSGALQESTPQQQASFAERLITQPKLMLSLIYTLLGIVVALSLALFIFIEIERQHPQNIAYGFGLLALLLVLTFVNKALLFTGAVI